MVSDAELAERVHHFLKSSDLKKTTNNSVRRKLESEFGLDLSHKMCFLREQVDRFLQTNYVSSEEEPDLTHPLNNANDDVSDSEDDYHQPGVKLTLTPNQTTCAKPIDKFQRSGKQNKENNKKQNTSGKFCKLSRKLQKFLGVRSMARTEVVKHVWKYVKEKNLLDPMGGKFFRCDEALRDLFGINIIHITILEKVLTHHIRPSGSSASMKPRHKDKQHKEEREEDPDGLEAKAKHQRKSYSGFLAPLPLSDTLMKFLGTGESQLTRAYVIKRVWEYIKEKNLQDPNDKKTVICDEKLKELFNVDSFHGFTVSKLLTAHFVKT